MKINMKHPPSVLNRSFKKRQGTSREFVLKLKNFRSGSVPEKKVIDFTRGFAVMIKARLSITQALDISIDRSDDENFKHILKVVSAKVNAGHSLADSLSAFPGVFKPLYIHLVEVGEASGVLDEVLFRLTEYMTKSFGFRKKIKMALVYPGVVLSVAAGAMIFMLVVMIPAFAEMYRDFDAELPTITLFVLGLSEWMTRFFWIQIMGILLVGTACYQLYRKPAIRYKADRLIFKLPFWGGILLNNVIVRFCQTLGTLIKSRITLLNALSIIHKSENNLLVKEALSNVLKAVKKGSSFGASLKNNRIFPSIVLQMISVGEETAELDKMLFHISDHFQTEVDLKVETLTSVIEPVLIVILGVILGFLIVAMYLPMFEMMNVIG